MNICFIAEGNYKIGLGHIMRSIALAKEFRKKNSDVYFLSIDREGILKIKENKFMIISKLQNFDIIIVDKYDITKEFFYEVKKYTKLLIYIDDLNMFDYPVDLLINGSLIAKELNYPKSYNKQLLLGSKYNILREEFFSVKPIKIKNEVKDIIITTGGADCNNLTSHLVEIIRSNCSFNNLTLHIIIGPAFKNVDVLKKKLNQYNKIIIYENIKNISKVMLNSDLAIASGGGTLYELGVCGIPTLAIIMAKNQEPIVRKMDSLGYIKSLGWYNEIDKNKVYNLLNEMIYNKNKRSNISMKQKKMIDGKGTQRIIKEIIDIFKKSGGI